MKSWVSLTFLAFSLDVTARGDLLTLPYHANYLAQDFIDIVESRYNVVGTQQESSASTDFVRMLLSLASSERSEFNLNLYLLVSRCPQGNVSYGTSIFSALAFPDRVVLNASFYGTSSALDPPCIR